MTASRAALLALALLAARPALAGTVRHRETVSLESAYDSNARRVENGPLVRPDVLAYLFATGHLAWRGGPTAFSLDLKAGGKHFAQVHAEDVAVGRLGLSVSHALGRSGILGLDVSYKDAFQQGDRVGSLSQSSPLWCSPPEDQASADYRCNRRDLRDGAVTGRLDLRLGGRLSLGLDAGITGFEYKPNPIFSYLGPQGLVALRWRVAPGHRLTLTGAAALRGYDPRSTTYATRIVGGVPELVPTGVSRVEQVYTGGLAWSYRGPLLLTVGLTVARSVNNGEGLDVWRGRLALAAAAFLGPRTTVVVSAAFQAALWPSGDVYRNLTPIGDESEQENSLGLKLAQRLTRHLQVVVKLQTYANELSAQALPFARQVFQTGIELDL